MKTIWLIYVIIPLAYCAPRSKTKNLPQTVYDQKQTGDYNIQLHLKDFQIIALLSDESLGGLGDYDYNYDYADLTIKPTATNVTLKPIENEATTLKPKPDDTVLVTNQETSPPSSQVTSSSSRPDKVDKIEATTSKPVVISTTSTSTVIQQATEAEFHNSPDKIKVQILQSPSVAIVPVDDMGTHSEQSPLGEVVHYRRCVNGYSRDKKGRCRRVRRPGTQSPFDFSRLASNLAAKFRQASAEDSSLSDSSESIEE